MFFMDEKVLEVKNLKKYFYKPKLVKAVDGVSFSVAKGEIVGILGPNGAGKTTTIQMLLGVLTPTDGEIFYFGQKFTGKEDKIKKQINFASAYSDLPALLTVWENLDVFARIFEVNDRKGRIKKVMKAFQISNLKKRQFKQLSAGQKTRVMLAKAFLNWPKIILLDEPTASLDPENASQVRDFLNYQQKEYKVTILLTSHNMKEVEELCHRVVFLNQGKIIACDTPQKLISATQPAQLRLRITEGKETAERFLRDNKFIYNYKKGKLVINLSEKEIAKVLYFFSQKEVCYSDIEILRPTLEDFFIKIAKGKYEFQKNLSG
jgi:ABC-2 type transport system ATP-binding protein